MFTFAGNLKFPILYNEKKFKPKGGNNQMEFLYFPEDKSEYIPGIISILVIFVLSIFIVRLLMRASRKEVQQLEQQGYPAFYNGTNDAIEKKQDETGPHKEQHVKSEGAKSEPDKKP